MIIFLRVNLYANTIYSGENYCVFNLKISISLNSKKSLIVFLLANSYEFLGKFRSPEFIQPSNSFKSLLIGDIAGFLIYFPLFLRLVSI